MIVNPFSFTKNFMGHQNNDNVTRTVSLTLHAFTPPLAHAPHAAHFWSGSASSGNFFRCLRKKPDPESSRSKSRFRESFGIVGLRDSAEISKTTDLLDFLFLRFFYYERLNGGKGMNASLSLSPTKPVPESAERERETRKK